MVGEEETAYIVRGQNIFIFRNMQFFINALTFEPDCYKCQITLIFLALPAASKYGHKTYVLCLVQIL